MFSLDALFCDVDDFCHDFEPEWKTRLLHHGGIKRVRAKSLCLSEIMTILIAFHQHGDCTSCLRSSVPRRQNHYRTLGSRFKSGNPPNALPRNFKHFYLDYVKQHWHSAFPGLPSYQRFVEWTPSTLIPLCVYLKHCFGSPTGIGFVDATSLKVGHNRRIKRHKVFEG